VKQEDIVIGKVYEVLVSGRPVAFRVDRSFEKSRYTFSRNVGSDGKCKVFLYFEGVNLRTGRTISLRATRLRRLHPRHHHPDDVIASEASLRRAQGVL
jgi:hypothetical protein